MNSAVMSPHQPGMSRWFSLYLDVIRLAAASFVVYAHSNVRFLYPEPLPFAEYAHSAVTVFFVLSGFVVAFVYDRRENTPASYASSRASRILSLSVFAVLLTPVVDVIGRSLSPDLYIDTIPSDYVPIRIAASLVFLAEVWTVSITTFSNVPYWSLNYEVWYYVLFGLYCFVAPSRRWVWIGAVCLLLGPKVLLMAPCWLVGVYAYRWQRNPGTTRLWLSALLWITSVMGFVAYHRFDLMRAFSEGVVLQYVGTWFHTQLNFSRYFAADWLLACIVAINFVTARHLMGALPALAANRFRWVSYAGGLTYALYIIHVPFLYMWGAVLHSQTASAVKYAIVIGLILLSVGIVAAMGEWVRPRLRKRFEMAFTALERRFQERAQVLNRA